MMSGVGAPLPEVVRGRQRAHHPGVRASAFGVRADGSPNAKRQTPNAKHRARQVRARVVALAQEYREACRQHEEIAVYVFRLNGEAPDVLLDEEERVWEGREQRRRALFAALEELERLEEEGR